MSEEQKISAYERVQLARDRNRPNIRDYIDHLFTGFFEQRGDRHSMDDAAVVGGIALLGSRPVTVIGHQKGRTLEENLRCNFGMPQPEGYRKAMRLMDQAEKFRRPVITFVDTPGAYPGLEAEQHGQGEAIARSIQLMSGLTVPVISIVTGEGSSGGALAISVANSLWMLENSVYSVLSPEGFAAILWKDGTRAADAAELMRLTAADLLDYGLADRVISEPAEGFGGDCSGFYASLREQLETELDRLSSQSPAALKHARYKKFRAIGRGKAGQAQRGNERR